MSPNNCEKLYSEITLSAWKKFWINDKLEKIKNPLLYIIKKAFDSFYLSTPTENITPAEFKIYLYDYLPEEKLIFTGSGDDDSHIYVKDCFDLLLYKDFKSKITGKNHYDLFIDYVCSLSFSSLLNGIYLEIHMKKISDHFILVLNEYLKEI